MKKTAFTLAEVLMTLGIVGVVAAVILPTVIRNVTTAQVTPKLNKAVSMFEQANTALLSTNKVDSLTDSGYLASVDKYVDELKKYLKITKTNYGYLAKDGMSYDFTIEKKVSTDSIPAHKQLIGLITIDINGNAKPNELGTDRFNYDWFNDGGLKGTDREIVVAPPPPPPEPEQTPPPDPDPPQEQKVCRAKSSLVPNDNIYYCGLSKEEYFDWKNGTSYATAFGSKATEEGRYKFCNYAHRMYHEGCCFEFKTWPGVWKCGLKWEEYDTYELYY